MVEGGEVLGLVTLHNVKEVPRQRRSTVTVREVMTPLDQLRSVEPDRALWSAMQELTEEGVNQLPVMEGRRLVGMLARDGVLTFIQLRVELGL